MIEHKSNLITKYIEARINSKKLAIREVISSLETRDKRSIYSKYIKGKPVHVWTSYDSSIDVYEDDFSINGDRPVIPFLEKRKAAGQLSYVIDLASGGRAVRDLRQRQLISAGLSVGLADLRSKWFRNKDKLLNIEVLAGSLLLGNSWYGIKNWLQEKSPTGVDLIMCRSIGGFKDHPLPLMAIYIQKSIALLRQGGMITAYIPGHIPFQQAQEWFDNDLKTRRDLRVTYQYKHNHGALRIEKLVSTEK